MPFEYKQGELKKSFPRDKNDKTFPVKENENGEYAVPVEVVGGQVGSSGAGSLVPFDEDNYFEEGGTWDVYTFTFTKPMNVLVLGNTGESDFYFTFGNSNIPIRAKAGTEGTLYRKDKPFTSITLYCNFNSFYGYGGNV